MSRYTNAQNFLFKNISFPQFLETVSGVEAFEVFHLFHLSFGACPHLTSSVISMGEGYMLKNHRSSRVKC